MMSGRSAGVTAADAVVVEAAAVAAVSAIDATALVIIIKGAYWISSNSSFIQYSDRNIGLLSL